MARPNIVLVMADQLAPHFTSTYGHRVVKTPHLDGLAERGVRFDAMYCHSPPVRTFTLCDDFGASRECNRGVGQRLGVPGIGSDLCPLSAECWVSHDPYRQDATLSGPIRCMALKSV